jgi:hypothetical protein
MTQKYFIEIVRRVVQQQAVSDILENLENPPGRQPPERIKKLSLFYKQLDKDQQANLKDILNEATEMTLFGMFCVIDGVRSIESGESKGALELWYRKGETTILLNNIEDDFLHDLM